jgi:hypothetical protein
MPDERTRSAPGKRLAALGLKAAATMVVSCALGEVTARTWFSESCAGWSVAQSLRQPWRFGSPYSDDVFYTMRYGWMPKSARDARPDCAPYYDAQAGWTSYQFAPPSYAHVDEAEIGERRVVLLFGDSFACCSGKRERACFQQLMRESPFLAISVPPRTSSSTTCAVLEQVA